MNVVHIVVMGVSGCGKSTVGARLAQALGVDCVEGDDFHPPRNVALMAAGTALTDADRQGWLQALAAQLHAAQAAGRGLVLSCSALKRSYRELLRAPVPGLLFVHLQADADLLAARVATRAHRYMPASLLASQLATLEPPAADENALTVDAAEPVERIVQTVLQHLATRRRWH
jgi:gluconokinase